MKPRRWQLSWANGDASPGDLSLGWEVAGEEDFSTDISCTVTWQGC